MVKDTENKENLSDSELDQLNDYCMTNLKILSSIKVGNKICYDKTTSKFNIDEWTYAQPFTRWWNDEGRQVTVKSLEEFINKVFKAINNIYSSEISEPYADVKNTYYTDLTQTQSIFKEQNSTLLLSFINEMQNCVTGLNNLKQTYKDDISIISSLDIIIEKLNVRIKKIQNILQVNFNTPKSKKT
tara:strand:- start:1311 stop:1868 length:558 start_codon:yes stop_codon:yes gene_type:complete